VTPRDVVIVRASLDDVDAIAGILLDAFREFEPLYTPGGFRATTPTAPEIAARFHEGPVWIARLDGRPIGTVAAVPRGDEVYVRSMAVTPAARGAGAAAALLEAVTRFSTAHGARRLRLSTTPFLHGAIRLYERAGFQRLPEPLDLHGTLLFTMVKDIGGGRRQ
jgi:GNAT superfamily N-acetyltransferase